MWKRNMPSLLCNNSAMEQVESRDLIIDELNDRVAVFEKIRSCWGSPSTTAKEMNDEAPRTQKLVDDSQCTEGSGAVASKRSNHSSVHKTKLDLSERNLDQVVNDPAEGIESDCHWNVCGQAGGTSGFLLLLVAISRFASGNVQSSRQR
jgi:hypothetical protein